jgi:hypothetical protein
MIALTRVIKELPSVDAVLGHYGKWQWNRSRFYCKLRVESVEGTVEYTVHILESRRYKCRGWPKRVERLNCYVTSTRSTAMDVLFARMHIEIRLTRFVLQEGSRHTYRTIAGSSYFFICHRPGDKELQLHFLIDVIPRLFHSKNDSL